MSLSFTRSVHTPELFHEGSVRYYPSIYYLVFQMVSFHQVLPATPCPSNRHILMSQNSTDFVGSLNCMKYIYRAANVQEIQISRSKVFTAFCTPHKMKTTHYESSKYLEELSGDPAPHVRYLRPRQRFFERVRR